MAVYVSPKNDHARIATLVQTAQSGESDAAKGQLRIAPQTLEKVLNLLPRFKELHNELSRQKAVRAGNVSEKGEKLIYLNKVMRHLWTGIRNRVDRQNLPVEVLKYYQLPVSGITPKLNNTVALIPLAESIISGDANAIAAGFEPMSNPDAEELQNALTMAKQELKEVAESDSSVDEYEEKLAALRGEVDELIKKIVADLRYFLYEEDEPSQRRIMRRYGMKFRSEQETIQESTEE